MEIRFEEVRELCGHGSPSATGIYVSAENIYKGAGCLTVSVNGTVVYKKEGVQPHQKVLIEEDWFYPGPWIEDTFEFLRQLKETNWQPYRPEGYLDEYKPHKK